MQPETKLLSKLLTKPTGWLAEMEHTPVSEQDTPAVKDGSLLT